jgi:hypothetical protein
MEGWFAVQYNKDTISWQGKDWTDLLAWSMKEDIIKDWGFQSCRSLAMTQAHLFYSASLLGVLGNKSGHCEYEAHAAVMS